MMLERLRRYRSGAPRDPDDQEEGEERQEWRETEDQPKCKRGGEFPKRYILVFHLFSMVTLCYFVRTNMGILVRHVTKDDYEAGRILAALYYGYVLTQLPSSLFIQWVGAKVVLLVAVGVWTIFDIGTLWYYGTIPLLLVARFGVGMGQGVVFPSNHNFAAAWFPKAEKTFLVAILASGMDCGTIFSLLFTPQIDGVWSWEYVFIICGGMACLWLVSFWYLCVNKPEEHRAISQSELDLILSSRTTASAAVEKTLTWRTMTRSPCVWAVAAANVGNNYGWFVLLSWIPKYFVNNFEVDLSADPFLAASPYITSWFMMQFGGWFSDYLICKMKFRVLHVRKFMCVLSTVIPAISLTLLNIPMKASSASLVLCGAVGFSRLSVGSYWVNMIDIAPDHSEQVLAFSNTLGTLPGIIGNVVTGAILANTGSWGAVFAVTSVIYVIGGCIFMIFADDQPIVKHKEREKEKNSLTA